MLTNVRIKFDENPSAKLWWDKDAFFEDEKTGLIIVRGIHGQLNVIAYRDFNFGGEIWRSEIDTQTFAVIPADVPNPLKFGWSFWPFKSKKLGVTPS